MGNLLITNHLKLKAHLINFMHLPWHKHQCSDRSLPPWWYLPGSPAGAASSPHTTAAYTLSPMSSPSGTRQPPRLASFCYELNYQTTETAKLINWKVDENRK